MKPRVSIGLPVYNGQEFLEETLHSILNQTFNDFELIICDNASTDRTAEICRSFAKRDRRIRYYRNEINLGAAKNFNRVFSLARGEYFKWSAHDDLCSPEFLARCVEVLDNDPTVVLCYTRVGTIDRNGEPLPNEEVPLRATAFEPKDRFYDILHAHMCYEIFGLIRRSALQRTDLMGNYAHGDGVLLAWLGLLGRFHEVPDYLFFSRRHALQAGSRLADRYMWTEWFDPKMKGRIVLPYWRMFFAYVKAIHKTPMPVRQRWGCYWLMVRWMGWYRHKLGKNFRYAVIQFFRGVFGRRSVLEGRALRKEKRLKPHLEFDAQCVRTGTTWDQGRE
ncbi:MAG: glycosyltransferase family 2 protein [Phycisphaerae bacterium]|jgi:glycosyltransferase involved in cell wall biosynthesis|nr:glycosyltransferase family 2 protein [Phycisphaerae bacterium]